MTIWRKVGIGVFASVLVTASAATAIYVVRLAKRSKQQTAQVHSTETKQAPADASDGSLKVGTQSGLGGGLPELSPAAGGTSGGTASGGGNSGQADSTNFSEYEKYKDQKSALFGDVRVGTGNEVTAGKKVAIYYKGWLTNGTLFDQSAAEKPGEQPKPLAFVVGEHQVVAGMEQGIMGMKGGGKRRIIIPPAAGYGERGYGPVPSNSVLVFDIELVDLQ
jgi:FKBP-type peptidyl-prolyl cis-trans isomerase